MQSPRDNGLHTTGAMEILPETAISPSSPFSPSSLECDDASHYPAWAIDGKHFRRHDVCLIIVHHLKNGIVAVEEDAFKVVDLQNARAEDAVEVPDYWE